MKAFFSTLRFVEIVCLKLLHLKMTPFGLPSHNSLELGALHRARSCSSIRATLAFFFTLKNKRFVCLTFFQNH